MKLITTEDEYNKALKQHDVLIDSDPKTKERQEAELLALLTEEYEEQHYKIIVS